MQKAKKFSAKLLAMLLSITLLFTLLIPSVSAASENDITIQTTLTDGMTLKGSKKTFDVIARLNGERISSSVTLNGEAVKVNWDDTTKTSYTLQLTKEGENIVEVTATSGSLSKTIAYRIQYEKAEAGDLIGYATFTLETLTLGTGFLVEPIQVPIYEGENSAQLLDRVLTEQGFAYDHTGKLESGFYLSMIANGGHPEFKKAGCQTEGARLDKIPEDPSESIPAALREVLENEGYWPVDTSYYVEDGKVYALGEFEFTYMSGWMYAVNGVFPNVGFSDTYPTDGDVIRAQFTLYGYGADIGGGYAMGGETTDFYPIAQKDRLLTLLASVNSSQEKDILLADDSVKNAFDQAMSVAAQLDAFQEAVDSSAAALDAAVQTFRDNQQAAAAVDALINAIGIVTLDSETAITEARAAYDALTATQQALVTKLEMVKTAEKALAELKATEADKAKAAAVDALINAIGTVTLDSEKAITEARTAYEALTATQQALVTKLEMLTAAETTLEQLKTDAAALAQAKADAKAELEDYKDAADYREAEEAELAKAITAGKAAIDAAADKTAVDAALKAAKTVMDAIKTDAQLTAEETQGNVTQPDDSSETTDIPQTGDTTPVGAVVLMLLTASALALTLRRKKA